MIWLAAYVGTIFAANWAIATFGLVPVGFGLMAPAGVYGLAAEAKRRGKWAHMGRVNSWQRFRAAAAAGFDSVDGTKLRFHPADGMGADHVVDRAVRVRTAAVA